MGGTTGEEWAKHGCVRSRRKEGVEPRPPQSKQEIEKKRNEETSCDV